MHINDAAGGFIVVGVFAGFLQDLLGHKETSEWRGTGGVMCCISCGNVVNVKHRQPKVGQAGSDCWDAQKFLPLTNQEVWNIVDDLKVQHDHFLTLPKWPKTRWENLCKEKGFNLEVEGLLMDVELRGLYRPVDHTIRDWQHTMVQDGVANTHVAALCHRLKEHGIGIERVQEFSQIVNYPSAYGKLDRSAFSPGRLKAQTIASFSSIMVTMVTVLHFFVEIFAKNVVPEEFRAFTKLHHIIGILRMGCEDAMPHVDNLRKLIAAHLKAFRELYNHVGIKPKMHHAFHIPDGMDWLGKLLSCFVTERKHKLIKKAALYIFRHLEHTVLTDVVNTTFQQVLSGHDLYKDAFLIMPHEVEVSGIDFRRSRSACCRIGHVSARDLVMNVHGRVGRVVSCWQRISDELIVLEVDAYPCLNNDISVVSSAQAVRGFFEQVDLVDTLLWIEDSPGIIRVSVPPAVLYRDS